MTETKDQKTGTKESTLSTSTTDAPKTRSETPESEQKQRKEEASKRSKVAENVANLHVDGDPKHDHTFRTVPGVIVACECGQVQVEG